MRERLDCADFAYGDPPHSVLVFGIHDTMRVSANLDATIDAAMQPRVPVGGKG